MQLSEDITYAMVPSQLGLVLVATSEKGVCAIMIDDNAPVLRDSLKSRFPRAILTEDRQGLESVATEVVRFIEAPGSQLNVALDIRGSDFQKRVWDALRGIPVGLTASYAEIAARLKAPTAVRAVAGACAANLLAVAIPCHRVVRGDGGLSGYRWGVGRKQALLKAEGAR